MSSRVNRLMQGVTYVIMGEMGDVTSGLDEVFK